MPGKNGNGTSSRSSSSGAAAPSSTGNADSIKVLVRVRPHRAQDGDDGCLQVLDPSSLEIKGKGTFSFDKVLGEDCTQEQIFGYSGKKVIENCLEGYNGTIFAYGQTGSGKTHTMMGPEEAEEDAPGANRGIIPRALEYLFSLISRDKTKEYFCTASFLEIYNEKIFDLLDVSSTGLQLREDMQHGVVVSDLTEQSVTSPSEAMKVLQSGGANRRVASTSMNRESSRSHAVFTMVIKSSETLENGTKNIRFSRLNLIDLAGSERQKDTKAAGHRLREAGSINKSLSALGNVITALVDIATGKQRHVAYRDSKLTFLLRDSLGGNTKTFLIANVNPASRCFGETLSTLQFARRAKMIQNKAVINQDTSGSVEALRAELKKLRAELDAYKSGSVAVQPAPVMEAPGSPAPTTAVPSTPERSGGLDTEAFAAAAAAQTPSFSPRNRSGSFADDLERFRVLRKYKEQIARLKEELRGETAAREAEHREAASKLLDTEAELAATRSALVELEAAMRGGKGGAGAASALAAATAASGASGTGTDDPAALKHEMLKLRHKLERSEEGAAKVTADLNAMSGELNKVQEQLEEARTRASELEDKIADTNLLREAAERSEAQLRRETEERIQRLELEASDATSAKMRAEEELERVTVENETLQSELETLSDENAFHMSRVEQLRSDMAVGVEVNKTLEDEVVALEERLAEETEMLEKVTAQLKGTSDGSEMAKLVEQNGKLADEVRGKEKDILALRTEFDATTAQLEECKQELETAQRKIEEDGSDMARLIEYVQLLKSQLAEAEGVTGSKDGEMAECRAALQQAEEARDVLMSQLELAAQQVLAEREEHEQANRSFMEELERTEERYSVLLAEADREVKTLTREVEKLRKELAAAAAAAASSSSSS